MRYSITLSALLWLVACGGSSGGTSSNPVLTEIDLLRIEAERLSQAVAGRELTDPSFVPPGGSLDYSGIATFGFFTESSRGDGVGGDMTVSVDFAGNTATGQIDNFISRDGDARAGTMTMSNGQLVRLPDGIAMIADLSGTLEIIGDVKALDGSLTGAFVGADADYISGAIETSFPLELGGDGGIVDVDVNGGFIVESQ